MSSSALLPHLSDREILHIFVEVTNGRGRHGGFLETFGQSIANADATNFQLLRDGAIRVIDKYDLRRYLDTFDGSEATTS